MTQPTKPKKSSHAESSWPALLLGWIFIVVVLFGIVFLIIHSKPERRLVCDDTLRRSTSLTKFGTCHRE